MRSAPVMLVGAALAGAALQGCSTHTLRAEPVVCETRDSIRIGFSTNDPRPCRECRSCDVHPRHSRSVPCRRREATPAGIRWDAVFPPPEVTHDELRYGSWAPERWRNDADLGAAPAGAIDAISASWPEPWRPDLDFERTGRTSTDPERFIYSSRRPWLVWRHAPYRPYRR